MYSLIKRVNTIRQQPFVKCVRNLNLPKRSNLTVPYNTGQPTHANKTSLFTFAWQYHSRNKCS